MDSHICGPCGQHFFQLEDFVAHKKSGCKGQKHLIDDKNTNLGPDVRLRNLTFKALMERKYCYNAIKSHLRVHHNYPSIKKFQEKVLNLAAFNKKYKVVKVKELDRELRELKGEKAPRQTRKSPGSLTAAPKCKICHKGKITNLHNHLLNSHDITSMEEYEEFPTKEDVKADFAYISSIRSYCEICRKGLCSVRYKIEHMMKKHGIDITAMDKVIPKSEASLLSSATSPEEYEEFLPREDAVADIAHISSKSSYCEICKKGLCNVKYKIEHMMKKHGIDVTALDQMIPPSEASLPDSSAVVNASDCEICRNGLFLNEIYKETHMRQMHSIETMGTNTSPDPLQSDADPLANVESVIIKEENVQQELARDTFIG